MTKDKSPSLTIDAITFYETPSEIEGSPYWVDLWASVNGYRIGLQVKPKSYLAASMSIYTGKAKSSQAHGYALFTQQFGGKVFTVMPSHGEVESKMRDQISQEVQRLKFLPSGPHAPLPNSRV